MSWSKKIMFFSTKQGLARVEAFFSCSNESVHSVHSELYTFPTTLTVLLRGNWPNSKKRR